ncbi:unnamed protein product [Oppiella nova]|uniref:Uncharacterized protein n=1 Tax=Oppiella nova TaxID=334625 RepID=A0A7R9MC38_9ACAR|nr:unnamed protein product [Oppiella nova]CAG2174652.1 unnamed protein product [Oppiella nova]
MALALDIKRKSIGGHSLKNNKELDGKPSGQTTQTCDKELEPEPQMSFRMRLLYTSIMLLIHHDFGVSVSGFAPSYVDFCAMLQTNMTYIGLIPICQAFGGICGSLCAWNNSNNVWLMEMWQHNSPSVLLFSQAIYGIGTIIGPLVVKPFLSGLSAGDNSGPEAINSTVDWSELSNEVSHKLKTPFLITGLIEVIGPVLLVLLFFIKPYKYTSLSKLAEDRAVTDADKARLDEQRRIIPKKTLIVCVSIFFATGFMTENMYMDFGPSFFQFIPLRLSAQTAADIASTMAIALTGGRFLCVFIALKVRTQYLIYVHTCIIWVGVIIQYFGQDVLGVLWASAAIICYGYSCIYVALYGFVNQYFEMTDAVGTIFIACYNSLYLFLPYIIGDNIETTPNIFMYLMFGCS